MNIDLENKVGKLISEKLSDYQKHAEDSLTALQKLNRASTNDDIKHLIEDGIAFENHIHGQIRAILKG